MRSTRIDDIEVLRAVAIIFVILHHFNGNLLPLNLPMWHGFFDYFQGAVGVDLFFAVSGFVIIKSVYTSFSQMSNRKYFIREAGAFWIRRAWRLMPSAWLWLGVLLACAAFFNKSGVFLSVETNVYATLAGIFNYANFRFASTFGSSPYGASFVYWSLSLEEQFYLLLPIVFFVFKRQLVLLLISLVVWQLVSERGLLMMVLRTDALLMGVLIGLWSFKQSYAKWEPLFLRKKNVLSIGCIWLLLFSMTIVVSDKLEAIPLQRSIVSLIAALMVFVASYDKNYFHVSGILKRVLLWVGSRSYGLYLIHVPVFFFMREVWYRLDLERPVVVDGEMALLVGLSLVLMFMLCELNYRFVETPLRRKGVSIVNRFKVKREMELSVAEQVTAKKQMNHIASTSG